MPKFDVKVPLTGQDGNAMVIIGRTRTALRRAGATVEELTEYSREATSGDYDHVLQTTMEWVNVT